MPEGDTVFVVARRLHMAMAGRILESTDFRVPALATVKLDGLTVENVHARGKHLFIALQWGRTIHSHLAMDGEWFLYALGDKWTRPSSWARVVLQTNEWQVVGFRLAKLELIATDQEPELFSYLGPDPLREDWDPSVALRRLLSNPDRSIADVLLDQRVIAGPGNVYKSEICFLRGLDPGTPVSAIEDPAALVDLTARLMQANRREGMQLTTGDNRSGRRHWVYGRAGEPCRRCGTEIRRTTEVLGRITYWCPHCQPAKEQAPLTRAQGPMSKDPSSSWVPGSRSN